MNTFLCDCNRLSDAKQGHMTTIIVCRCTVRVDGIQCIIQMDGHKFSQCHVHYFTRGCLPGKQTVKELWGQTTRIFADSVSEKGCNCKVGMCILLPAVNGILMQKHKH